MSRNIDGQLLRRFMPDLHKFYKGERVVTSELALANGVVRERKYGVVVGYGRKENTLVARFDGEQTTRTLHEDFLSGRQETPQELTWPEVINDEAEIIDDAAAPDTPSEGTMSRTTPSEDGAK